MATEIPCPKCGKPTISLGSSNVRHRNDHGKPEEESIEEIRQCAHDCQMCVNYSGDDTGK